MSNEQTEKLLNILSSIDNSLAILASSLDSIQDTDFIRETPSLINGVWSELTKVKGAIETLGYE